MSERITIDDIQKKKESGEKFIMLTAYDYPTGKLVDEAGVEMILVGDSLANVILGLDSTRDVGMEEMIHHTKAVNRAVKKSMLVGDMPFESYQMDPKMSVDNAKRFIDEAGCNAVKLEWFDDCLEVAEKIINVGIPVMGHVGLTPQTADRLGGFKVQGKDAQTAQTMIEQAKELERKGCFSVVLECVPDRIAKIITKELNVPTIGIGAGKYCDGQVLVTHDIVGLFEKFRPKFVKQYVDLKPQIQKAIKAFRKEVSNNEFPDPDHSYKINQAEFKKLNEFLKEN